MLCDTKFVKGLSSLQGECWKSSQKQISYCLQIHFTPRHTTSLQSSLKDLYFQLLEGSVCVQLYAQLSVRQDCYDSDGQQPGHVNARETWAEPEILDV